MPQLRMLGREGFQLVDPRAYAVIATLHNHGVFAAGGMLIGSHAYGVILNRMGVRSAPFVTDHVDLARRETPAFDEVRSRSLLDMLGETGLSFAEVPSLDHKRPATSFKQVGKEAFHLDLLVPSRDETFRVVAVPELGAHATALPYLGYLLAESQDAIAIMREGCCAVRVPLPERFAVHKVVVSQLRTGRNAKSEKDLRQAIVLLATLGEAHGGAIADAVKALPKRARTHFVKGRERMRKALEARAPWAWEEPNS